MGVRNGGNILQSHAADRNAGPLSLCLCTHEMRLLPSCAAGARAIRSGSKRDSPNAQFQTREISLGNYRTLLSQIYEGEQEFVGESLSLRQYR